MVQIFSVLMAMKDLIIQNLLKPFKEKNSNIYTGN